MKKADFTSRPTFDDVRADATTAAALAQIIAEYAMNAAYSETERLEALELAIVHLSDVVTELQAKCEVGTGFADWSNWIEAPKESEQADNKRR